jgi:membrane protein implicated in regulation of membrane protease activity
MVPVTGQSVPPNDGNWVIDDYESYEHRMIVLNGNLIVQNGGDLRLRNVDLRVNCDSEREYVIKVEDGGSVDLYDSSISEYSGYQYVIIVETAGQLNVYNSNVTGYCTIEAPVDDSGGFDMVVILAIMIVIIIITVLLAMTMRPRSRYENSDEFKDDMVGHVGVVVKSVQNDDFKGRVKIENKIWNARTDSWAPLRIGERVKVTDRSNNLLTVEKMSKINY